MLNQNPVDSKYCELSIDLFPRCYFLLNRRQKMVVDQRRVSVQTQINLFKVAEPQTCVCLSVETQLRAEN